MTTAERTRQLDLYGEAVHSLCRRYGHLGELARGFPADMAKVFDTAVAYEEPSVYRTLSELSDEDLTRVWRYARARAIVHQIKRMRPGQTCV